MSGSSKADLAAVATSTILTADQLMRAIEASHEGKEDHAKKHIGYAAVGAAVAVGAMELLRRDELHKRRESDSSEEDITICEDSHHHHHHGHHCEEVVRVEPRHGRDTTPSGHKRRLAEEIVGAYALGQEIMGHKKHHVAHVVAEVIGAVAALKDTSDHVQGVE
ncbi:unnamed protein product [Alternaria burnsii]|nr:unnamed protein product [Alternaria burnsii]